MRTGCGRPGTAWNFAITVEVAAPDVLASTDLSSQVRELEVASTTPNPRLRNSENRPRGFPLPGP